jgi:hypothetical protein
VPVSAALAWIRIPIPETGCVAARRMAKSGLPGRYDGMSGRAGGSMRRWLKSAPEFARLGAIATGLDVCRSNSISVGSKV